MVYHQMKWMPKSKRLQANRNIRKGLTMSNSNNHIKKQNSNVRNRQIENSIAKEIAMLRREGEYLYRSINVKKKLLIVLPIITGILAFMCLGLCQPDGYTDMEFWDCHYLFIATFALGFYAYYWWNYKLEFDPRL